MVTSLVSSVIHGTQLSHQVQVCGFLVIVSVINLRQCYPKRSSHNKVSGIFISFFCYLFDPLCCLVDLRCYFVDPRRCFVGPPRCLVYPLRVVAYPLRVVTYPLCCLVDPRCCFLGASCCLLYPLDVVAYPLRVLVNVSLNGCLLKALDSSCHGVGATHLVICDGIGQVLNKAV